MNVHRPRVLIIGLDGATATVLEPLMARGFLPHLQALRSRGVQCTLMSSEPYVTGPAWTSLATGKRPDSHGIFDWSVPVPGRYRRRMANANTRQDLAFWEILAQNGLRSGTLNMPLTYPPSPETSFAVSDMLTPPGAPAFTRPRDLQRALEAFGYQIDLRKHDYFERGFQPFLRDLVAMTRARGRAIRLCLSRFPWDAAIAVFTEPDRLQHAFWHCLEPDALETHEGRQAASYFQALDSELGQIIAQVGTGTHVYVVSDHGFGPHRKTFYVNDWLEARGYLVFGVERSWTRRSRRIVQGGLRRTSHSLTRLASLEGRLLRQPTHSSPESRHRPVPRIRALLDWLDQALGDRFTPDASIIDWDRTTAFAPSPHGIQINVRGREPRGIVPPGSYESTRREIAEALVAVTDPRDGVPIHSEVVSREQRYSGTRTDMAPDLVYSFTAPDTSWRIGTIATLQHERRRRGHRLEGSFLAVDLEWETGTHTPEGILVAAGPDIEPAGSSAATHHLWDVVPTLLYHLDQPIPPDLDGALMRTLIRRDVLDSRPERRSLRSAIRRVSGEQGRDSAPGEILTSGAQDSIEEHLRALGYLS